MSVWTQYWCWSYVFSALGFFSDCLPALFGSSSSQPVCDILSLLTVYIWVSLLHHCTNRETLWLACTSNFFYVTCAVWVFLYLFYVNCVHLFMVFCAFPVSLWFWVIFFPVCYILSRFWVELRHGCLQASVENIMKEKMPKKGGRWWFSWRSRNSDIKLVRSLISGHICNQQFSFIHYITDSNTTCQGLECFINQKTFVVFQESEVVGAPEESAHSLQSVSRWHKSTGLSPEELMAY